MLSVNCRTDRRAICSLTLSLYSDKSTLVYIYIYAISLRIPQTYAEAYAVYTYIYIYAIWLLRPTRTPTLYLYIHINGQGFGRIFWPTPPQYGHALGPPWVRPGQAPGRSRTALGRPQGAPGRANSRHMSPNEHQKQHRASPTCPK